MKLHATGVEKLRREKTYGLHADGNSLYFRLRDNGASWIFRFKIPLKNAPWATADDYVAVDLATGRTLKGETFDAAKHKRIGRTVELGLGSYPTVTLADARKKRDKLLAEIDQRRDPRKFEREDALPVKGKTFQEYAEEYIAEKEKGLRSAKHKQQWRNTLRDYAYPLLGKMLPKDIRMADVLAVIKPMWATKTETASRVRQRIEMVLSYAFVVEEIDRLNPARWAGNLSETGLQSPRALMDQRAEAEGKEHRHHAAAPWQDVPAIMDKLRAKADVTSALALRFSILTACRSTECRALDWSEIDIDNAVWTLPPCPIKEQESARCAAQRGSYRNPENYEGEEARG